MAIVAGVAIGLFVLTCTVVGVRMLLLARRTGGTPERLMGAGMTLIGAFGYPGGLVSGMGRVAADEVSLPLWCAATLVTHLGILLMYAFTWRVFRPREGWAPGILAAAALVCVVSFAMILHALVTAPPGTPSTEIATLGTSLFLVASSGCFLWAGIEGALEWKSARRRLALGLAEPVVVNRFALWAWFGIFASGINAISAIALFAGTSISAAPPFMLAFGVLGVAGALAMYLAFLPPPPYLRWVRGAA